MGFGGLLVASDWPPVGIAGFDGARTAARLVNLPVRRAGCPATPRGSSRQCRGTRPVARARTCSRGWSRAPRGVAPVCMLAASGGSHPAVIASWCFVAAALVNAVLDRARRDCVARRPRMRARAQALMSSGRPALRRCGPRARRGIGRARGRALSIDAGTTSWISTLARGSRARRVADGAPRVRAHLGAGRTGPAHLMSGPRPRPSGAAVATDAARVLSAAREVGTTGWSYDAKARGPSASRRRYRLVPTTCFNCEAACGLVAYIDKESGEIRKVEGNPHHPGSRGKNCAKGPATLNQIHDPDRVLYPMKRVGARGARVASSARPGTR